MQVPKKQCKRRRSSPCGGSENSCVQKRPLRPNHVWSYDFVEDRTEGGRKLRMLVVIDEFKRHGIDASFRSVDWSIMLDKVGHFDFDAVILGWQVSATVPPDAYQIWHSSQAVEEGSNHVGFVNEEVDRILEEYRVEFDEGRRKVLYDRFQEIVYEEQPYTFLYAPSSVAVWDRRFEGVRWHPGIGTELNEWWVPAEQQKY